MNAHFQRGSLIPTDAIFVKCQSVKYLDINGQVVIKPEEASSSKVLAGVVEKLVSQITQSVRLIADKHRLTSGKVRRLNPGLYLNYFLSFYLFVF